jgi:predicted cupin superfamily sugar epimerase
VTADEVIAALGLKPHPEGGHYCETFRDSVTGAGGRPTGTAIYYLLKAGERSHWHKVDAAEIWHWYAGAPLCLAIAPDAEAEAVVHILGPHLAQGERPQIVVPAHAWQSAESMGAWTLTGCTVAPGFEFAGLEMAPPEWHPGDSGA